MNKQIKIIIAIGIIGILIMVAGYVMGSGPSSIPTIFSESNVPAGAASLKDVSTEEIHSIELNLFASKISIKSGENFDMSGSGEFDCYVENGTLHAGATENKRSTKILGISVPSKWICGYGSYVLVIPPNAKLDQITINTNHSNLTCDSLIASKININVKHGNLITDTLSADNASINVGGRFTASKTKIERTGTITSKQNLYVGTSRSSKESVLNNTTLSNKRGGITLYGKLTGNGSLQSDAGNIETVLSGTASNYTIPSNEHLTVHSSAIDSSDGKNQKQFGTVSINASRGNASVSFE